MSYFGIPELDENMDGLLNMVDRLDEIQGQLNEISVTTTSEDEYIEITLDSQGRVSDLQLNPGAMRLASEDLAESLKDTINRAQVELQERAQELLAEVTRAANVDISPDSGSPADVKEAVNDLIRIGRTGADLSPEEVNASLLEATRKATGVNLR